MPGGTYDYRGVGDEGELQDALADGWWLTQADAQASAIESGASLGDEQPEQSVKRGRGRPRRVVV